ncbi:alpha/beta fold hydrolase [Nocardioides taihuensis]|uniref:Alpha/beta fold hydrolase n=1 Tax=Nocardioides taihuensis TaxID=1835606 RepID=A0ABW0BMQ2_9ACTN
MSHLQHAVSIDGTRIAYRSTGAGPPLVMVHGATADHTALSLVVPLLEPHFAVHVLDRRGRGHSGDAPTYDITLEYADVAAVVDAVAARSGRSVSLYGHSYGAVCALGAARLSDHVEQLLLYEPGYGSVLDDVDRLVERLDALVATGHPDRALEHFYRAGVGMTADEVAAMRGQPSWDARVRTTPTLGRELRTVARLAFDPEEHRDIDVPTVLLLGGASTSGQKAVVAQVAAGLRRSSVITLPGQAHAAQVTAPHLLAEAVVGHLPADAPTPSEDPRAHQPRSTHEAPPHHPSSLRGRALRQYRPGGHRPDRVGFPGRARRRRGRA